MTSSGRPIGVAKVARLETIFGSASGSRMYRRPALVATEYFIFHFVNSSNRVLFLSSAVADDGRRATP